MNSPSLCILQYRSVADTLKFYASDQTAGHGLKWTKCPAVKNFIKMPLKGSFKLLESIRCLHRNIKRF